MPKHTIDTDALSTDTELILVELDDLRSAFGGEDSTTLAALPPPKTVMCPQW